MTSENSKIFKMFDAMERSTLDLEDEPSDPGKDLMTINPDLIGEHLMVEHKEGVGKAATVQDIMDDFTATRRHLIKISQQCQEATDTALRMAAIAPNPEYLNVVSSLLGKSMVIGEKMLKMHEKALQISRALKELGRIEDPEEEKKPEKKKGTLGDILEASRE